MSWDPHVFVGKDVATGKNTDGQLDVTMQGIDSESGLSRFVGILFWISVAFTIDEGG